MHGDEQQMGGPHAPGGLGSLQRGEWGVLSGYEAPLAPVVNGEKQPWEFPDASSPVCT